ncbi:MAG: hypothetical protein JSW61_01250 [Candidatus Thorarchaeota archaeon]|nr:MAG: hypothetical protein JSW61_01250 [Candidatus Thorarchaeota archaeon]
MDESTGVNHEDPDMVLFGGSPTTIRLVVGIVLAAVFAVLALLPMSGFIAAGGVATLMSFAVCMTPLFGVILGPARGFVMGLIAGVLGTLVSIPIGGGVFLLVPTTILGPALAGLFVGLSLKPLHEWKSVKIPGPILTAAFFLVIIVLYEIPYYSAWWFMTPYMLTLGVAIILQGMRIEYSPDREDWRKYAQLVPFTLIGTMADHSMMAMGSVYLLGLEPVLLGYGIFPVMLLERIFVIAVSTVLLSIILNVFHKEHWMQV